MEILLCILSVLFKSFFNYSQPTVDEIPIRGFKPIFRNEMNYLNITKDGLFVGKSPNSERTHFYDYFIAKAKRLVEAHGDEPKQTIIEQFCDNFDGNK